MYSRKCHRLLYLKGTQQPFEVIRVVTVYYRLWAGVTYVMVSKGPRCRRVTVRGVPNAILSPEPA